MSNLAGVIFIVTTLSASSCLAQDKTSQIGHWGLGEGKDLMSDEPRVTAVINSLDRSSELVITCRGPKLAVVAKALASTAGKKTISVRHRFGTSPPQQQTWRVLRPNEFALYGDQAARFTVAVGEHQQLLLEIGGQVRQFNIQGADQIVQRMVAVCG